MDYTIIAVIVVGLSLMLLLALPPLVGLIAVPVLIIGCMLYVFLKHLEAEDTKMKSKGDTK